MASAAPVLTQDRERQERFEERVERFEDRLEDNGFFFDQDGFFNRTRFDDRFDEDDFSEVAGINQKLDQETGSGGADQSFTISGAGGNSNQCLGISGAENAGNVQNSTGSIQYASDIKDLEQDDTGTDLTVNGTSNVACDQQVNQIAAGG